MNRENSLIKIINCHFSILKSIIRMNNFVKFFELFKFFFAINTLLPTEFLRYLRSRLDVFNLFSLNEYQKSATLL